MKPIQITPILKAAVAFPYVNCLLPDNDFGIITNNVEEAEEVGIIFKHLYSDKRGIALPQYSATCEYCYCIMEDDLVNFDYLHRAEKHVTYLYSLEDFK